MKHTTTSFIEKAKAVHGDRYDYSLTNYQKAKEKLKIICSEHGIFEQTPHAHTGGQGCRSCAHENLNNTHWNFVKLYKDINPDLGKEQGILYCVKI